MQIEPLLTSEETSKVLRIGKKKLLNLCRKNLITYHHFGGKFVFKPSDVNAYLERTRVPAIPAPRVKN